MNEELILVDEQDNPIGIVEKLEAHQLGLLHRALSVFVFNENNELLLQQRALNKYHSGGLWTNTCCSHPRPNEECLEAAKRRLLEEMGFETQLNFKTKFLYKVAFENGLTENELDYIFIGNYNSNPKINLEEVMNFEWKSLEAIKNDLNSNPEKFTYWFKLAIEQFF